MSDKARRMSGGGRKAEPVVKRERPFGRNDRAARESRRRAAAYGRARGNA